MDKTALILDFPTGVYPARYRSGFLIVHLKVTNA